jgi:hypothetical protein
MGNKFAKIHASQVYLVVENVETLDIGWCVCVCVCVMSRFLLRWGFASRPVGGDMIVSLYDTHEAEPLGLNWYISLTVSLTPRDAIDTLASFRHRYRISHFIWVRQEWRIMNWEFRVFYAERSADWGAMERIELCSTCCRLALFTSSVVLFRLKPDGWSYQNEPLMLRWWLMY